VPSLFNECGFARRRGDVQWRTDCFYDEKILQKEENKPSPRKAK
jgi:hypothetical protein